jgi:hypothetical protein
MVHLVAVVREDDIVDEEVVVGETPQQLRDTCLAEPAGADIAEPAQRGTRHRPGGQPGHDPHERIHRQARRHRGHEAGAGEAHQLEPVPTLARRQVCAPRPLELHDSG